MEPFRQGPTNQGFIIDNENRGFWHVCGPAAQAAQRPDCTADAGCKVSDYA
jgi:hypothetical protein